MTKFYALNKTAGGFTFLELLVVLVLIGILSALGYPAYTGYIQGAKDKEAQATIRSIAAAQETYRLLNGSYFTSAQCSNDQSASQVAAALLSNNKLNTTYFNYCTSSDATKTTPNFIVKAVNRNAPKEFTVDQDNNELTINSGVASVGF